MPLLSLAKYGNELIERGELPPIGWSRVRAPFALCINAEGDLTQIIDLRYEEEGREKKYVRAPDFDVPYRDKHTAKVTPFFLCDNATYLLGMAGDGESYEKAEKRFDGCRKLHKQLLENVDLPEAEALLKFFATITPEEVMERDDYKSVEADFLMASYILFMYDETGEFMSDNAVLRKVWDDYYYKTTSDDGVERAYCILTERDNEPIARLHPSMTGVPGAQSSGSSIVSFGANLQLSAYNYFDKQQGMNAPVSIKTAQTYGSALRYLLRSSKHKYTVGNTHYLFWADHDLDSETAEAFASSAFDGRMGRFETEDNSLAKTVRAVLTGSHNASELATDEALLDNDFYILAIRPHSARLAVTDFQKNSFGEFLKNIEKHYARTEVYLGSEKLEYIRFSANGMLQVLKDAAGNSVLPPNAEETLINAIINDGRYPQVLLPAVLNRIRVEKNVEASHAGIIKAFTLKNGKNPYAREVSTVSLNTDSTYLPYVLGQLFWEYELLQKDAIGDVNCTVRQKFFSKAMERPITVFPMLEKKTTIYTGKLKRIRPNQAIMHEITLGNIMDKICEPYPQRLSLEEQGAFAQGYYHAKKETYRKKKD